MGFTAKDVVPFSQARARLSELAEQVKAGAEKIIVALIDAQRLDHYHQLETARIHLLLLDEVRKGLDDLSAGRVTDARSSLQKLVKKRATKMKPRHGK